MPGDGCLDEWGEMPTTVKLVLDADTTVRTEVARPLCVDLDFEPLSVRDPWMTRKMKVIQRREV
jgi:hypothetical protein